MLVSRGEKAIHDRFGDSLQVKSAKLQYRGRDLRDRNALGTMPPTFRHVPDMLGLSGRSVVVVPCAPGCLPVAGILY